MTLRTVHLVAVFSEPFDLESLSEIQPAGTYAVEELEELFEGSTWKAFRKISANIHLPALGTTAMVQHLAPISNAELVMAMVTPVIHST